MGMNLNEMVFPLENFAKRENPETRRCTSFGEAAAMIANDPDTFSIINFLSASITDFLKNLPFGLHTMMTIMILKIPSNSNSTLGETMIMV